MQLIKTQLRTNFDWPLCEGSMRFAGRNAVLSILQESALTVAQAGVARPIQGIFPRFSPESVIRILSPAQQLAGDITPSNHCGKSSPCSLPHRPNFQYWRTVREARLIE